MSLPNANTTYTVIYLIFLLNKYIYIFAKYIHIYIYMNVYFNIVTHPVSFAIVEGDLRYNEVRTILLNFKH